MGGGGLRAITKTGPGMERVRPSTWRQVTTWAVVTGQSALAPPPSVIMTNSEKPGTDPYWAPDSSPLGMSII